MRSLFSLVAVMVVALVILANHASAQCVDCAGGQSVLMQAAPMASDSCVDCVGGAVSSVTYGPATVTYGPPTVVSSYEVASAPVTYVTQGAAVRTRPRLFQRVRRLRNLVQFLSNVRGAFRSNQSNRTNGGC